ncbi:hypothetical protein LMG27174_00966 [Paraburkholderia rhynchosiae]|uniref:Uncharacterized protein n=1 Tax=Paraburkholderia rhynchosiae TaxID=487049 RepID=A0A6J5AJ04_9BURK|nr:hypothetical protein LMG27174_00966 [Paraburkholderia rhynchosiae]
MSTPMLREARIFAGRACCETWRGHELKRRESRVNPATPEAASKHHYARARIHRMDSHIYRTSSGTPRGSPRIAAARG